MNYFSCTNNSLVIINLRQTLLNISVNNIYYGQVAIANITTNGNGTVIVYINGRNYTVNIVDGKGYFNITREVGNLVPGNWSVGVIYNEDPYFRYALNQTSFEVYRLDTAINATPINITYGQDEIINVTVNENATGFIGLVIGNQNYVQRIVNGTAQFNITGLAARQYNATVIYQPTNYFNEASTNITFTVNSTTDYDIDVLVDDITYGENATVRVKLPDGASGNVTIWIDGFEYPDVIIGSDGVARLENIANLAGGSHEVNVTYNGCNLYSPKDKNRTNFTVKPTDDWKMDISVDEHPYGENSTITVTNIPQAAKNITITIGVTPYTVNVTGGVATLRLDNQTVGMHSASAYYA